MALDEVISEKLVVVGVFFSVPFLLWMGVEMWITVRGIAGFVFAGAACTDWNAKGGARPHCGRLRQPVVESRPAFRVTQAS